MRHHIARQLMRWCNVLFVEVVSGAGPSEPTRVEDRLAVVSISLRGGVPLRLYVNDPLCHWVCNRRGTAQLEQLIVGITASSKLLFNFLHSFPEIMRIKSIDARVYVCVDEFPRMWRRKKRGNPLRYFYQSRLQQWYEHRVARGADLCLSPHNGIVRKLQGHCRHVELFLHAHEFRNLEADSSFERTAAPKQTINAASANINVCYMGFIHYRLCDATIREVLLQPDMTLHMIGPTAPDYNREVLASFSNLVWHGSVTGDALGELLRKMDVLIIPYDAAIPEVEVLTSTSKLFQYIAAGKPIVTLRLPHFMNLPGEVLTSTDNPAEFVRKIREARDSDDHAARLIRRRIAEENTWERRGFELCSIISRVLGIHLGGVHGGVPAGAAGDPAGVPLPAPDRAESQ